jgi:N-acetylneuraminic acid mutarotase
MLMFRRLFGALVIAAATSVAQAHFVFVVPESDGQRATVVFSEDLRPDEQVDVAGIQSLKLFARQGKDGERALALAAGKHALTTEIDGKNAGVVRGSVLYGVQQRGQGKPFLLAYHPKTLLGDAFAAGNELGESLATAEITPVGKPGEVKFKVTLLGKPVAGAEVNLLLPGGKTEKAKTDDAGLTPAFAETGRYGAWVRCTETKAGQHAGKEYAEIRHYPTLVTDIAPAGAVPASSKQPGVPAGAPGASRINVGGHAALAAHETAVAARPTTRPVEASSYPKLPEATSSFGAVASDGWLYVYGGHVANTHTYHTTAVSGRFFRMKLDGGTAWEELAGGPAVQGMNLAAHNGKIYRVGGMQPRNASGQRPDLFSITDAARFDPATGKWEALPELPEPRSSHDLVVAGDLLVVVGGWNMKGRNEDSEWLNTTLVMDLSQPKLSWKKVKQPFERRALTAAVHNGKVYVAGGFTEDSDPSKQVDVYDPAADRWTTAPELPGKPLNGFSPAAISDGKTLYVSVADGTLYRLDEKANAWAPLASGTPRIVHRLATNGSKVLAVGGAAKGVNLDLIEAAPLFAAEQR